jgi:hypothetical protein
MQTIDFIAVDKGSYAGSTSAILTELAGTAVWDTKLSRPSVSDHLPVEGHLPV